jgi:hypothetical protein
METLATPLLPGVIGELRIIEETLRKTRPSGLVASGIVTRQNVYHEATSEFQECQDEIFIAWVRKKKVTRGWLS